MWRRSVHCATLVSLCLAAPVTTVAAQARSDYPKATGPSFWRAASGVALTNWVTWAYNFYVQRWPWANVGVQSWGHNLRQGFTWDNDCFLDDQLAHPYHGSFYHNAARASGYGYWSSFPFVAAGSAGWELFGETIQASLNDLINTTMGGMALGEVSYRLSALIGAGPAGRRSGLGRMAGAFVASPWAATHEVLDGKAWRRFDPTPGPAGVPIRFSVGRQERQPFVELALRYGDAFGSGFTRPYDAFEFRMRVSPGSDTIVQHVGISGLLVRHPLSQSRKGQLFFGLFQHYEYDEVPGIKSSGNSMSAALIYQRNLGVRTWLNLSAHAEGVVLGAMSSDHGHYWRRDFDLGPGIGARAGVSFTRDGREWFRLDSRLLWLHSIHGSGGNHLASSLRAVAAIPVGAGMGVGGELALSTRHSRYRDLEPVTVRVPRARAFLSWAP
jgi:hypothetical protein